MEKTLFHFMVSFCVYVCVCMCVRACVHMDIYDMVRWQQNKRSGRKNQMSEIYF